MQRVVPVTVHIAVLVKSQQLSLSDVLRMTAACADQLRNQAAPLWGWAAPNVSFAADDAHLRPDAQAIQVFDDSDQASALGYHATDGRGLPYGKIFVSDILANGGHVLDGALSVSSVLSHEMLEIAGDPFCDTFDPGPDGYEYARELADPVEGDSYPLDGVTVSNFILPAWCGQIAPSGTRYDYLGATSGPFAMSRGGYVIRKKNGALDQVYAAEYPAWKRDGKSHPAARTVRRSRAA